MDLRGLAHAIGRVARDPRRLSRLHYSKIFAAAHLPFEKDLLWLLRRVFGIRLRDFMRLERDLLDDAAFRTGIEQRMLQVRGRRMQLFGTHDSLDAHPGGRLLYYCVRLSGPQKAVDTGVLDGLSTAFILKGLNDNDTGHLWSIDLPAYSAVGSSTDCMEHGTLPPGREPGWLIPEDLRSRWTLLAGSSRDLMQPLLKQLQRIDFFFHDSLHTREHMLWEYGTAWRYLRKGGLLLSDDIFWNPAFWTATRRFRAYRLIMRGIGLTRKDTPLMPGSRGTAAPARTAAADAPDRR